MHQRLLRLRMPVSMSLPQRGVLRPRDRCLPLQPRMARGVLRERLSRRILRRRLSPEVRLWRRKPLMPSGDRGVRHSTQVEDRIQGMRRMLERRKMQPEREGSLRLCSWLARETLPQRLDDEEFLINLYLYHYLPMHLHLYLHHYLPPLYLYLDLYLELYLYMYLYLPRNQNICLYLYM